MDDKDLIINSDERNIAKCEEKLENSFQQELLSYSDSSLSPNINDTNKSQDKPKFSVFMEQFSLLMWKNYLIFKRKTFMTLFILFSPIAFGLLLIYFQYLEDTMGNYIDASPKKIQTKNMAHCIGNNCITIGFGIIGDPEKNSSYEWIYQTMEYVSKMNSFTYGKDIKLLSIGESSDYFKYLIDHSNTTYYGVLFCTSFWNISGYKLPCTFSNKSWGEMKFYSILINSTLEPDNMLTSPMIPGVLDESLLKLKISLDNGIIEYLAKQNNFPQIPKINLTYSRYPSPYNRLAQGMNVVIQVGAFYFFLPSMFFFMIFMVEIVLEKEKKLRIELNVMGLGQISFWLSWISTGIIFIVLITIIQILTGLACNFSFFWNVPFLLNFIFFFLFGMSMAFLSILLSTLVSSQRTAYSTSFAFLLAGFIMQVLLSNGAVRNTIFFPADLSIYNRLARYLFNTYPPYHFACWFSNVAAVASDHYIFSEYKWEPGRHYQWKDLFTKNNNTSLLVKSNPDEAIYSLIFMFFDLIAFAIITIYFDQVIEGNRGTRKSLFFFLPSGCSVEENQTQRKRSSFHSKGLSSLLISSKNSAASEIEKIKQSESEETENMGIRIIGITKIYMNAYCSNSSNQIKALNNVYLQLNQNEITSILGHNGAGKSTLISVISGIVSPTLGSIKAFNYNIAENLENIQEMLGLVPQSDSLWDDLTAEEHLRIFARLKGIPNELIMNRIEEKLRDVSLLKDKDTIVRNFSGGMKRRLTFAIAIISDPKIILLDEPTTGMDPISKREVWNIIKRLKKNRVLIMATHNMEEADLLSDKVVILADGIVKCVGTPLSLKNSFGDGYVMSLNCSPEKTKEASMIIQSIIPFSKLVDESGGALMMSIPKSQFELSTKIFSKLASDMLTSENSFHFSKEIEDKLIRLKLISNDIGLCHPTLERAFFKICQKEDQRKK